ncbi:MAG: heavy metal-associated domain-containing protein [bacterium]
MFGIKKNASQGTTAVFIITGMHCVSCSMSIDGGLEDLAGVHSSKTNYRQARTVVEYDPAAVVIADLIGIIQKLGYEAKLE